MLTVRLVIVACIPPVMTLLTFMVRVPLRMIIDWVLVRVLWIDLSGNG